MYKMSKSIITLGGGMVGSAIARDLKESNYNVTVADWNKGVQSYLAPFDINYIKLDFLNNDALQKSIENFDLVIGAVPGFMGYEILKTVIDAGKNIVDISFMPEDSRELIYLAIKNGAQIIKHQTHIPDKEMSHEAKKIVPGNAKSSI